MNNFISLAVFGLSIFLFPLKSTSLQNTSQSLSSCLSRKDNTELSQFKEPNTLSGVFEGDKSSEEELDFLENLHLFSDEKITSKEGIVTLGELETTIDELILAKRKAAEENLEQVNIRCKNIVFSGKGLKLVKSKDKANYFKIIATDLPGVSFLKQIHKHQKWFYELTKEEAPEISLLPDKVKKPIFKRCREDFHQIVLIFDPEGLDAEQLELLQDRFGGKYLNEENRFENEIPQDQLVENGFKSTFASSVFKFRQIGRVSMLDDNLLAQLMEEVGCKNEIEAEIEELLQKEEKTYRLVSPEQKKYSLRSARLLQSIICILKMGAFKNGRPVGYLSDEFKKTILDLLESQAFTLFIWGSKRFVTYPILLPIQFWKLIFRTEYSNPNSDYEFITTGAIGRMPILNIAHKEFKDFIFGNQFLVNYTLKPIHIFCNSFPNFNLSTFFNIYDRKLISRSFLWLDNEIGLMLPENFIDEFSKIAKGNQVKLSEQRLTSLMNWENEIIFNFNSDYSIYVKLVSLLFKLRDILGDLKFIEERLLEIRPDSSDAPFLKEIKRGTIKLLNDLIEYYSKCISMQENPQDAYQKLKALLVELLPEISTVID